MKGDARVVQRLNEILVGEMTAINQYFLGAKLCRQRGYTRLAARIHAESLEEMKHADRLIERILFLEGLPNLQKLDKLRIAESVPDQLRADLALERRTVEELNGAIKLARDRGDNGSAELLEELLVSAERHVGWLETQLGLLRDLGDVPYLAQQVHKDG
jgi:bacterioferritin